MDHTGISQSDISVEIPCVIEYFKEKCIFITGVTGFLGKVLLEKLLRSCPDIDKIYVLIRPKKGQSSEARLQSLTDSKIFDKLRSVCPNFQDKIQVIFGDITAPDLGISTHDQNLLAQTVNVVFHSAATVRFNEPLKLAVEVNVLPVRKIILLCRTFKKLQVIVHISTAYCNCERSVIDETVYPLTVDVSKLLSTLEWMDDSMVADITPKLLGNKPNTYTFTKHIAEHIISTEGQDLPFAIVRPSIIGASWKEPFPGWVDNYSGPSGLYIAAGKGILRSMRGEHSAVADVIPVDIPVNIMITVAWYTAVMKPSSILIYHSTAGAKNPFTWGEMQNLVCRFYKQFPLDSAFRRPRIGFTNNSFLHDYWIFVSHLIPAYIADLSYAMIGSKPKMVQTYKKLHKSMDELRYFTSKHWDFTQNNLDYLYEQLSPEECKIFYCDPRPLHWPTYIENYCRGTKQYVLNEDMAGLPAARAHLRKLRNIRYTFNTLIVILIWRLLVARSSLAKNVWYFILSLAFKLVRYFHVSISL